MTTRLRILHAGPEICGIPAILAAHQRRLGHDARALRLGGHPFGYEPDFEVDIDPNSPRVARYATRLRAFAQMVGRFDVFHLHAGGMLLEYLDLPILRAMGKVVVAHVHGNDIREVPPPDIPVEQLEIPVIAQRITMLPRQRRRRRLVETFADMVFVSTPDMLSLLRAEWLPSPVDLARWPQRAPRAIGQRLRVLHIPSARAIRGSEHVERAASILRQRGAQVDVEILQGVPHNRMADLYSSGDVVIDQMSIGWYGMVGVEAMAVGTPVASLTFPWLARRFGAPPVLAVSRQTLADDLEAAHADRTHLAEIREMAFAYVRRVHDAGRVAAILLDRYQDVLAARK